MSSQQQPDHESSSQYYPLQWLPPPTTSAQQYAPLSHRDPPLPASLQSSLSDQSGFAPAHHSQSLNRLYQSEPWLYPSRYAQHLPYPQHPLQFGGTSNQAIETSNQALEPSNQSFASDVFPPSYGYEYGYWPQQSFPYPTQSQLAHWRQYQPAPQTYPWLLTNAEASPSMPLQASSDFPDYLKSGDLLADFAARVDSQIHPAGTRRDRQEDNESVLVARAPRSLQRPQEQVDEHYHPEQPVRSRRPYQRYNFPRNNELLWILGYFGDHHRIMGHRDLAERFVPSHDSNPIIKAEEKALKTLLGPEGIQQYRAERDACGRHIWHSERRYVGYLSSRLPPNFRPPNLEALWARNPLPKETRRKQPTARNIAAGRAKTRRAQMRRTTDNAAQQDEDRQ